MPTISRRWQEDLKLPSIATGGAARRPSAAGGKEHLQDGDRPGLFANALDDNGQSVLGSTPRSTAMNGIADWRRQTGKLSAKRS